MICFCVSLDNCEPYLQWWASHTSRPTGGGRCIGHHWTSGASRSGPSICFPHESGLPIAPQCFSTISPSYFGRCRRCGCRPRCRPLCSNTSPAPCCCHWPRFSAVSERCRCPCPRRLWRSRACRSRRWWWFPVWRREERERKRKKEKKEKKERRENKCEQMWTNVNKCEQMWTNVNKCEQMWTNVNKCEQMWTNVNKCEPMWTNVNKCEQM